MSCSLLHFAVIHTRFSRSTLSYIFIYTTLIRFAEPRLSVQWLNYNIYSRWFPLHSIAYNQDTTPYNNTPTLHTLLTLQHSQHQRCPSRKIKLKDVEWISENFWKITPSVRNEKVLSATATGITQLTMVGRSCETHLRRLLRGACLQAMRGEH